MNISLFWNYVCPAALSIKDSWTEIVIRSLEEQPIGANKSVHPSSKSLVYFSSVSKPNGRKLAFFFTPRPIDGKLSAPHLYLLLLLYSSQN